MQLHKLAFFICASFLSRNQHCAERALTTTKVVYETLINSTYTYAN